MMGMEAFVRNHDSANHARYSDRGLDWWDEVRGSRGADSSAARCSSSDGICDVRTFGLDMFAMLAVCGGSAQTKTLEKT